ncbi:unnamed protein product [Leuciscus chuanchicus]
MEETGCVPSTYPLPQQACIALIVLVLIMFQMTEINTHVQMHVLHTIASSCPPTLRSTDPWRSACLSVSHHKHLFTHLHLYSPSPTKEWQRVPPCPPVVVFLLNEIISHPLHPSPHATPLSQSSSAPAAKGHSDASRFARKCNSNERSMSVILKLLNEGLSALVIPGRGVFWRDEGCFFHPALLVSPVLFALQETVMSPVPWVATAALQSPC